MLAFKTKRLSDARNNSVTQKMSKAKPRLPTLSKSLKVKGPTAMEKVLKQNLRKVVIYENKPRPAARGRSQNTASEGRNIFTNKCYNRHDMSTSAQQQCTKHVSTRSEHQPNIWHNLRIEEVQWVIWKLFRNLRTSEFIYRIYSIISRPFDCKPHKMMKKKLSKLRRINTVYFNFTHLLLRHDAPPKNNRAWRVQGRNEVVWRPGQEASLAPHVRTWGLWDANVLYWRKYLWHCWNFSTPPQSFGIALSDSTSR